MRKEIEKQTGFVKSFDGTPIYYEIRGEGKPIVFVYGIACLMNHWHHQVNAFSEHYKTICFDFRGHHQSGTPEDSANLNIESHARDIKALLDHLDVKQASFMAHSYGGQVVLKTFDLFPELFANFVFVNAFVKDPIHGMFGVDVAAKLFHYINETYKTHPDIIGNIWRATLRNPLCVPLLQVLGGFNMHLTSVKDIEVYARGVSSLEMDVFLTLFEDMMRYDASDVLEKIKVPTLIVSGDKDTVTPRSHQSQLHKGIRGSDFQNVPYGSHCTQLDLPEFVNLRIEKFYSQHGYAAEASAPKVPRRRKSAESNGHRST